MSLHPEQQYLDLLRDCLENGDPRTDRTGVGTLSVFGRQLRYDLFKGFPLYTTKRVFWKTAFKEMLWMLSGGNQLRELLEQNVRIWTDWPLDKYRKATGDEISQEDFEQRILEDEAFSAKWGYLGELYGRQWRAWKTPDGREIDQVSAVVDALKNNPTSRRMLWEGWNVAELETMSLPPCHKSYIWATNQRDNKLNLQIQIRSSDLGLGLAFNTCAGAMLVHIMAQQCGYEPGDLVISIADVHVYKSHLPMVKEILKREPRDWPELIIKRKPESLFDYTIDDFEVIGYDPHPHIPAPVAV
jgi:thymidylate synthase